MDRTMRLETQLQFFDNFRGTSVEQLRGKEWNDLLQSAKSLSLPKMCLKNKIVFNEKYYISRWKIGHKNTFLWKKNNFLDINLSRQN